MDPYVILGVTPNANQDEIKTAFRKEASKWHPDRAGDSTIAKDHFQAINQAYQKLRRKAPGNNKHSQSDADRNADIPPQDIEDAAWETLFEYAISLARTGMSADEIKLEIIRNGYDASISVKLVNAAFDFLDQHPNVSIDDVQDRQSPAYHSETKFFDKYTQVFLGGSFPFDGSRRQREAINYYQDVFTDHFLRDSEGQKFSLSKNAYLFKILLRGLLLLAMMLTTVFFFPQIGAWIPLGDLDLFQLPNIVLGLMLVWIAHKKLWGLFVLTGAILALSQYLFYARMPAALENGAGNTAILSLMIFLPFLLLVFGVNSFYFQRAKKVIETICLGYDDDKERLLLIKRRGGTSRIAAIVTTILLAAYFLHMIPEHKPLDTQLTGMLFPQATHAHNQGQIQAEKTISRSEKFFASGERLYHSTPADYRSAAIAYIEAVQSGSLLATYKLAFMYLHGQGLPQNDRKALHLFHQATQSPLSSQPHKLSVTTRWLAESYNALGIMHLAGYGTQRDAGVAREMFKQAVHFGAAAKEQSNIKAAHQRRENLRNWIKIPDFS